MNSKKRGKTRATKSWLILFLHLIGWESGTSLFSGPITEPSKVKTRQSWISFDSQLKIALICTLDKMLSIRKAYKIKKK